MISVIIPTYKSTHGLELCIRSAVRGQKNKNQIIVVADGFYDLHKDMLRTYADAVSVLELPTNVGACRALNLGVYNAEHDKVLLVNDDNVFPEHWDVKLEEDWSACMDRYPNGFVLTPNQIEPYSSMFKQFNIEDLGRDPSTFDLENFWQVDSQYSESGRLESNGSTWPALLKKGDYLRLGGFAEDYPSPAGYVTDWEFFLKCQMSKLDMIRTWSCHFYHFVALTNKSPDQINKSRIEELDCHEYAQYKWSKPIMHDPNSNKKYIQ